MRRLANDKTVTAARPGDADSYPPSRAQSVALRDTFVNLPPTRQNWTDEVQDRGGVSLCRISEETKTKGGRAFCTGTSVDTEQGTDNVK